MRFFSTINSLKYPLKSLNFLFLTKIKPSNLVINFNYSNSNYNKKNIKTLTTLHGGTVGHFKKGFFWPDLAHNNLPKAELSFYQTYSDTQKKILIKQ